MLSVKPLLSGSPSYANSNKYTQRAAVTHGVRICIALLSCEIKSQGVTRANASFSPQEPGVYSVMD